MLTLLLLLGSACAATGGSEDAERAATTTSAPDRTTTEATTTSTPERPAASLEEVVDALVAVGFGCDPIEAGEVDDTGFGFVETVSCQREEPGVTVMRYPPEYHDALIDVVGAEPTCSTPQPFVDGGSWFALAITTSAGPLDPDAALAVVGPVVDATGAAIAPVETCASP